MTNIIIENAPSDIIKIFGTRMKYDKNFIQFKKPKLTENGFTQEFEDEILRSENDPENTKYGPFEGKEAIDFLNKLIAE